MKAVYRKELSSFFYSRNGYVFTFFLLLFSGVFFTIFNINQKSGSFDNTVNMISYIFLLTVPMLTMKSYAKESGSNKISPFSIIPLSPLKIAFAKFAAASTVYLISVAVISIYPIFLYANGGGDILWSFCSITGLVLFGIFLISLGIFISSLTPNETVCGLVTFTVLLILYLYGTIQLVIPFDANTNFIILLICSAVLGWMVYQYTNILPLSLALTAVFASILTIVFLADSSLFYGSIYNILSFTSVSSHFYTFSSGIFTIEGIIYYVSFTLLFLLLTAILPHHKGIKIKDLLPEHKNQIKRSNKTVSCYYALLCLLCILITVGINLTTSVIPQSYTHFDLTDNRYHSISSTCSKYLSKIDTKITIYHLNSKENRDSSLELWIDSFEKQNEMITVIHIDSGEFPEFYSAFTDTPLSDNSFIVTSDKGSTVIRNEDLFLYGITFMNNEVATKLNYDSAIKTYNAYLETYREEYGINVSGYIAYHPTHYNKEAVILNAISSCTNDSGNQINIQGIKEISITPPSPTFSTVKATVFSLIFSVFIPLLPLITGFVILTFRRSYMKGNTL